MRTGRHVRSVLAALVLILGCSACRLDVGVVVTIDKDGRGTVAVTATADAELLTKEPAVFTELKLDDLTATGWTVTGPTLAATDGSRSITVTKAFSGTDAADRVLAELNGPKGPLRDLHVRQTRTFARVTTELDGTVALEGGLEALSDSELAAALGNKTPLADLVSGDVANDLGLTLTVHLPGRAGSEGTAGAAGSDAGTRSWTPSLHVGDSTPIAARAVLVDQGALDARRNHRLAVIGLVVYVVAAAAAVAWWLLRRRDAKFTGLAKLGGRSWPWSRGR
jgi:hypothetical protein